MTTNAKYHCWFEDEESGETLGLILDPFKRTLEPMRMLLA